MLCMRKLRAGGSDQRRFVAFGVCPRLAAGCCFRLLAQIMREETYSHQMITPSSISQRFLMRLCVLFKRPPSWSKTQSASRTQLLLLVGRDTLTWTHQFGFCWIVLTYLWSSNRSAKLGSPSSTPPWAHSLSVRVV